MGLTLLVELGEGGVAAGEGRAASVLNIAGFIMFVYVVKQSLYNTTPIFLMEKIIIIVISCYYGCYLFIIVNSKISLTHTYGRQRKSVSCNPSPHNSKLVLKRERDFKHFVILFPRK